MVDIDDYDGDAEHLAVRHRPEKGAPLKNGTEDEYIIALRAEVYRSTEDWRDHNRHDLEDDYGRQPLLTTRNGRMNRTSIRDAIYCVTRPCYYSADCPEGRDIDNCEAAEYGGYSKCPANVSPHAIRRGSITHFLTEDVPEKVVSDRMNVG